ncbi:hypothetical protein [Pseudobdellovibrio sp. HCB154]|uniref:hypothetical protein n=1 Tax=Pseudobdellovibrio sp. HCB154 TaxID=3386277 RepID=UPI00391749B0
MRELKIKHYSLFAASFLVLWWTDIPGGSILLLLLWQQMALYLWQTEFSKKSQLNCLVHSLTLFPMFFFLGAVSSFTHIYLKELNWTLLLFAGLLSFIMSYAVLVFGMSFFWDYKKDADLMSVYVENIQQIKNRKFYFFKLTVFFVVTTLLLQLFSVDYAIVAAYVLCHIMGKKYQTKLGYVASPPSQAT